MVMAHMKLGGLAGRHLWRPQRQLAGRTPPSGRGAPVVSHKKAVAATPAPRRPKKPDGGALKAEDGGGAVAHGHGHGHSHDHGHEHEAHSHDHKEHDHHHHHGEEGHSHSHSHGEEEELPWEPSRNPAMERGGGRGRILFIDAAVAGVAGDMMVAALADLGVPLGAMEEALHALPLDGYATRLLATERSGIVAPRFTVREEEPQPFRDYAAIRRMLEEADLREGTRRLALDAFRRLAEAEAAVHGMAVDEVHFHEVGAVDSIVDVVAASAGIDFVGADAVWVSPIPVGRGIILGAAHGPLPCPPPATLRVLCGAGLPTYDAGSDGELVTPTGACLVAAASEGRCSRWPAMAPEADAYGAGTKRRAERPNLLRLVLGVAA